MAIRIIRRVNFPRDVATGSGSFGVSIRILGDPGIFRVFVTVFPGRFAPFGVSFQFVREVSLGDSVYSARRVSSGCGFPWAIRLNFWRVDSPWPGFPRVTRFGSSVDCRILSNFSWISAGGSDGSACRFSLQFPCVSGHFSRRFSLRFSQAIQIVRRALFLWDFRGRFVSVSMCGADHLACPFSLGFPWVFRVDNFPCR